LSEISFKTDPASTDYVIEAGATRNFMALKLAEEQAMREIEAEKEEERTNPMKVTRTFSLNLNEWADPFRVDYSCNNVGIDF
jgi:hypothetical protein